MSVEAEAARLGVSVAALVAWYRGLADLPNPAEPEPVSKYLGGGWWETDGVKHRGKKEA